MINNVVLLGYCGADPESRILENGVLVARVSLATSETWTDANGEQQKHTDWHNVIFWRDAAERAAAMLRKGSMAFVEGRISYRKYTDRDNIERTATDITAKRFILCEKTDGRGAANFPTETPPERHSTRPENTEPADLPPSGEGETMPF